MTPLPNLSARFASCSVCNATAREFNVVYGNYPENDTEVAILSRSILQLLIDLASHIDVPMFMFSLTDTGTELAAPVVTIPAR